MTFAIWKPKYDIRQGDDPAVRAEAERPTIAHLPNGGYVVAWSEGDNQLKLKVYNGAGETNGVVYSVDPSSNLGMNIDIQPIGTDGSFAVGWNAGLSTNATLKVRVFTHNDDGTYTGGTVEEVQRNTTGSAELPSLSSWAGGGFASTYTNGSNVFLRLHNTDGSASRTIELFDTPSSSIDYPRVTEIAPNKLVVAYGRGDNIEFKIVTISGTTVTVSNAVDASPGEKSKIVALKDADGNPDGRFAVVQYKGNFKLVVKFYDQNGNRIGDVNNEIEIATNVWSYENYFDVTAIRGGRIAVTYSDLSQNIALKVLDIQGASGNPNNDPLIVSPVRHRQPTISEMEDGRLAIAYEDWTNGNYIDTTGVIVDPRLTKVKVEGTARNDYYIGSEYDGDELYGHGGNDTLYGGDGNDNFNGGAGADRFVGGNYFGEDDGTGDNVSYWGAKNAQGELEAVEIYLWDVAKNKGFEAEGDTYVGIEVISGTILNDVMEGDNANNTFWGDNGNDVLKGFGGNDTLKGAAGADTLYGGLGADRFEGGDLDGEPDVVTYEFSTAGVGLTVNLEDPTKNTREAAGDTYRGIDDLVGTAWDDVLVGRSTFSEFLGSHHNKLFGGDGNDTLEGGSGNDTLDGGTGFNFASYENASDSVTAYLDASQNNTGDAQGDVYYQDRYGSTIQGLIGSKHEDTLHGSNDSSEEGHNELRGLDGNDELRGLNGNDTLDGGAGADKLFGGDGHDLASYASSTVGVNVTLPTGGNGTVSGDTFDSIEGLIGSNLGDTLTGNADTNTLRGMGGNDVLNGGAGKDTLEGGAGNDTYYITSNDGDVVTESAGNGFDTVVASFDFSLASVAHVENLTAAAGTAAISLTGSSLANRITGNSGRNTLKGEGGNDVIVGGAGADAMYGGTGNDTFYVDNSSDRVIEYSRGGTDTVRTSVSFTLSSQLENLIAQGTKGVTLKGSSVGNTITGNSGANKIHGGLGNDLLRGGSGKDKFVFDTRPNKSSNVDKIYDFKSRDDGFYLDNKYFTKLGLGSSSGRKFKSDMFVEGSKAKDREDRIVYDRKKGNLYYDQDGTGSKAQVKIATISNKEKLYYHDFFVI